MQKVPRVKGPGKRKGKREGKNSERVVKNTVRMHQAEMLQISVPNLLEIYLFGTK